MSRLSRLSASLGVSQRGRGCRLAAAALVTAALGLSGPAAADYPGVVSTQVQTQVQSQVQTQAQKPVEAQNWAERMFSDLSHDFGNVARGADVKHVLTIENPYEETVRIVSIDKTCGCTQAQASQTEIGTHDSATIEVAMDTRKFMNEKKSNVIVTLAFTNASGLTAQETVRVPIRAYIRTDVVVEPGAASFGNVEVGQTDSRTLAVKYAGRADWAITGVEATSPYVNARLGERMVPAPGQVRYELDVTLAGDAPIGEIKDRLILRTNDGAGQTVPVLVTATVEPDIVVTPLSQGQVQLGRMRPGQTLRKTVVLRGKQPFEIAGISCRDYPEVFAVKPSPGAKSVQVMSLTVTAPSEAGELVDTFEVAVVGRDEPVTFEVAGVVE